MSELNSLAVVREWLHDNGECPTDGQFRAALKVVANEWYCNRENGMDVLASASLDELAELATALKDII